MKMRKTHLTTGVCSLCVMAGESWADSSSHKKWIDAGLSTLSKDKQTAEMKWFIDAAKTTNQKGSRNLGGLRN
jgi:glycerol transport system substrate-binding protein